MSFLPDTLPVEYEQAVPALPEPKPVNILIVDDMPEKLLVYETILNELNQNLVLARSGEEALKLVLKNEFAVILMDVNMPGMDGYEAADLIRKRRKSAHTPIIFLTAFSNEMDIAQGYASGAVDYLPTPVVPEILRAKVRVFIELFQMRQQATVQAEERARRTAAEEADRRKDEFLGMLAHELRNPLGPVRNAVYLLQKLGPPDPELKELRDIIDRQVNHMARLIDDLLDTTRLARGQVLLRKESCDLVKIVHQTIEDYRSIFEASGLTLKVDTPDRPMMVRGDPTRLVQVIGNLLHNAHKFTDPGGLVTVKLRESGLNAQLVISDTGIGIDASLLPAVFGVFHQGQQGLDRSRGGLGLGLALVKGLVELHYGEVTVSSDGAGQGSTFTINLPVSTTMPVTEPVAPAEEAQDNAKCRVLIIEDHADTAKTTRQILEADGYEVMTAHTGTEGLMAMRGFYPHVVLCDIGLPGMNGYEVARAIRQDSKLDGTYIIAITGYGRDEDRRQTREAGFNIHLTKPIDYGALRRIMATSLAVAGGRD